MKNSIKNQRSKSLSTGRIKQDNRLLEDGQILCKKWKPFYILLTEVMNEDKVITGKMGGELEIRKI